MQFSTSVREYLDGDNNEQNVQNTEKVNHPHHYTECSIECIQAMRVAFGDKEVCRFCIINAFKYIWRHRDKNKFEDIRKAKWYLDFVYDLIHGDTDCSPTVSDSELAEQYWRVYRLYEIARKEYDEQ